MRWGLWPEPGALLGAELYSGLNQRWLPAFIGVAILFITWFRLPQPRGGSQLALVLLGFYQTGLGMLAGATGPLGFAFMPWVTLIAAMVVAVILGSGSGS